MTSLVPDEGWLKLFVRFGATSLIAMWLAYSLTERITRAMDETRADTAATRILMQEHVSQMAAVALTMQQILNINLQNCINLGDDVLKRRRCFEAQFRQPQPEPNR